ncbi:MAG TPA: hypothetical protein VMC10_13780 [Stellaceae bacterium]|nr:hypothetical protein [Stellaceae bacterium]
MRAALAALFDSRAWIALSIACSLYALYEGISKIVEGEPVEGILDLVLTVVFTVNFVNRFRVLGGYFRRLVR